MFNACLKRFRDRGVYWGLGRRAYGESNAQEQPGIIKRFGV